MSEEIFDPTYWQRRLLKATQPHHAIFKCPEDRWRRIEAKHREILAAEIAPTASVLDVGCGWGRLLTLMHEEWVGDYLGVDLSPDFIRLARANYPSRAFICGDMRDIGLVQRVFDWAVLVSIRPMIINNKGLETWEKIEANLESVATNILYLEYDELDNGSVE